MRAKFIFLAVFALCVSALLTLFYNAGSKRSILEEEEGINAQWKRMNSRFVFCSYPKDHRLALKEQGDVVKFIFPDDGTKHYNGISLFFSLLLSNYVDNSCLEFLIRADDMRVFPCDLEVFLVQAQTKDVIFAKSLSVELNDAYQKISIPLKEFAIVHEKIGPFNNKVAPWDWEVDELLFSISSPLRREEIEVSIRGLAVRDDENNIIYELSYEL